jgi:hypothetical protein
MLLVTNTRLFGYGQFSWGIFVGSIPSNFRNRQIGEWKMAEEENYDH